MKTKTNDPKPEEAAEELPAVILKPDANLLERLAAARKLAGGMVEKKGRNKGVGEGYAYVTAADVATKVGDALAEVGVAVVPSYKQTFFHEFTSRSGTSMFLVGLDASFRFIDVVSQEEVTITTVAHGSDSGDKAAYKAMTGAFKYAALHALMLATGDDPEATVEESAPERPPITRRGTTEINTEDKPAETATVVGDDPNAPITSSQSRMLFAKATEAELTTDQFRTLIYLVTEKHKSTQLVNHEVTEILAALKNPDVIARAKSTEDQTKVLEQVTGGTREPAE